MRSKRIEDFVDRYPLIGPAFWIMSIQYYLVQIIVARAWNTPYSWVNNQISDLGNTSCGMYSDRYVCSPLHSLMNTSFITLGITMIVGSVLIYHEFKRSRGKAAGFGLMGIAGVGALLVGLFPENVNTVLHTVGATSVFLVGNLSLIVLGISLEMPRVLKIYTVFSGAIALLALLVAEIHWHVLIGTGGIERVVAFPQSIWLIVFGIYMSHNRYISSTKKRPW
jgi:hypothetical membrane protein